MVCRNYLCDNNEREEFDKILNKNEEEYQIELREKYNPEKIFDSTLKKIETLHSEEIQLIEYKEKWYQKLINKILIFFKH